MLRRIIGYFLHIYFVRVPVAGWVMLLLLGPGMALALPGMASGLLYFESGVSFVVTSVAAFLAAASSLSAFNLIRMGGEIRFRLNMRASRGRLYFVLAHLPPIALLATIIAASAAEGGSLGAGEMIAASLAGYGIAVAIVIISRALQLQFIESPADPADDPPDLLLLPGTPPTRWEKWLHNRPPARHLEAIKAVVLQLFRWVGVLIQPLVTRGYTERNILPGHIWAACLFAATFVFYVLIGAARQLHLGPLTIWAPLRPAVAFLDTITGGAANQVPALAWILFLLTFSVWLLSGITYCFDVYRIPLLVPLLIAASITGATPESDHFYRTVPEPVRPRALARTLLEDRVRAGRKLIVVSAPGGGIHAAAWTTWVLHKLSQQLGPGFMESVAAISGVSGGSVGIFHLAANDFDPKAAFDDAVKSSIDDAVWGLVVPDLFHVVNPWVRERTVDRGWALEQALERNAGLRPDLQEHGRELYLDSDAVQPSIRRPALLINATILENGVPILFSTSEFLPRPTTPLPACGPRIVNNEIADFHAIYDRRIRLVTAARMSATFPYVSPGARTLPDQTECPDYHLIDGGYYDNYGIFSLMRWLREGLGPGDEVLLIRSFPFPVSDISPTISSWANQFLLPLDGLMSARDSSQFLVSEALVKLFGPRVVEAQFRYQTYGACLSPPLNWALTQRQVDCITNMDWSTGPLFENLEKVALFLKGESSP